MVRDAVVFYRSFLEAIEELDEKDQLAAYRNIVNYGINGIEPNEKGPARAVFLMAKPQIDSNNKKYENGLKPKKQGTSKPEASHKQDGSKEEAKEKDKEKEKEKEKDKEKEKEKGNEKNKKIFIPPTPADVGAYCREKGYDIDPEAFVDFYTSKGWMIGKNKMSDWRAAVRTWTRSQRPQRQEKTAKPNVFDEWRDA